MKQRKQSDPLTALAMTLVTAFIAYRATPPEILQPIKDSITNYVSEKTRMVSDSLSQIKQSVSFADTAPTQQEQKEEVKQTPLELIVEDISDGVLDLAYHDYRIKIETELSEETTTDFTTRFNKFLTSTMKEEVLRRVTSLAIDAQLKGSPLSTQEYDESILDASLDLFWQLREPAPDPEHTPHAQFTGFLEKGLANCEGFTHWTFSIAYDLLKEPERLVGVTSFVNSAGTRTRHIFARYKADTGDVNFDQYGGRTNPRKHQQLHGHEVTITEMVVAMLKYNGVKKEALPEQLRTLYADNRKSNAKNTNAASVSTNGTSAFQFPVHDEQYRQKVPSKSVDDCVTIPLNIAGYIIGKEYEAFEQMVEEAKLKGCLHRIYNDLEDNIAFAKADEVQYSIQPAAVNRTQSCEITIRTSEYSDFIEALRLRGNIDTTRLYDVLNGKKIVRLGMLGVEVAFDFTNRIIPDVAATYK